MTTTSIKSTLEAAANPDTNFKLWLDELTAAQKWLEPWWDNAKKASARYSNKDANSYGSLAYVGGARGRRYNIFGANVLDILDYANTSKYTTARILGGIDINGSGGNIRLDSGVWMNTAAVTSLTISPTTANNFVQYSSFALYGIKG